MTSLGPTANLTGWARGLLAPLLAAMALACSPSTTIAQDPPPLPARVKAYTDLAMMGRRTCYVTFIADLTIYQVDAKLAKKPAPQYLPREGDHLACIKDAQAKLAETNAQAWVQIGSAALSQALLQRVHSAAVLALEGVRPQSGETEKAYEARKEQLVRDLADAVAQLMVLR